MLSRGQVQGEPSSERFSQTFFLKRGREAGATDTDKVNKALSNSAAIHRDVLVLRELLG